MNSVIQYIPHDPSIIEFIQNQTDEMCLQAVNISGLSLKFVLNKTMKICVCVCAVFRDKNAIDYVPEQFKEQCMDMVESKNKSKNEIVYRDVYIGSFSKKDLLQNKQLITKCQNMINFLLDHYETNVIDGYIVIGDEFKIDIFKNLII